MDASGILGNDMVLVGFSFSQAGDGEVVLSNSGVVALEPAVVIPLICAVDLPLYHVADNLAAAVIEGHSPAQ